MNRLIGIDPGLVTGICSVTEFADEVTNIEHMEVDQVGLGHYMEMLYGQWRKNGARPIVICESFIITPQTGKNTQAPWSLENIGIVRFFCSKAGIQLVFQTPAQAKRLASDEILKAAGMHSPSKGGHQNDAARHVAYYLMTELQLLQDAIRATM